MGVKNRTAALPAPPRPPARPPAQFEIDSCGTGGGSPDWYMEGGFSYHEGDAADPRMTRWAGRGGARQTNAGGGPAEWRGRRERS